MMVTPRTPLSARRDGTPSAPYVPAFQSSLPAVAGSTWRVSSAYVLPRYARSATRIAAPPSTSVMSVPDRPRSRSRAGSPGTGCSKS
ncbi:hypothetical protein ABGB18_10105 [Nonomuraea sp. B12E4]|uniref:hypothetical protein n=1 Tax=Nonomuraea sp. B12E4 TaxID=3153564 RepID=UPI00325D0DE4